MDSYYLNKKCNSEDGTNNDCWSEVESVSNMHMLFHNNTEENLINQKDCHLIEFENTKILLLVCIIILFIIIFFLLKKFKKNYVYL